VRALDNPWLYYKSNVEGEHVASYPETLNLKAWYYLSTFKICLMPRSFDYGKFVQVEQAACFQIQVQEESDIGMFSRQVPRVISLLCAQWDRLFARRRRELEQEARTWSALNMVDEELANVLLEKLIVADLVINPLHFMMSEFSLPYS
jgi:hypothetical protein